jgi:hypothetical protein
MTDALETARRAHDLSAFPTRRFLVEEKDGALALRERGRDEVSTLRAIGIGLRVSWVFAAALPLLGAVPRRGADPYLLVSMFCGLTVFLTNPFIPKLVWLDGPVVSTVRKSLWIGQAPEEIGYRDVAARRPTLVIDGRAIRPGRLVRVAVGVIRSETYREQLPAKFTVNLIMIDGIVTVEALDDEILAKRLAMVLAETLHVPHDPSEMPSYHESSSPGRDLGKQLAAMVVNFVGVLGVLFTGYSMSAFSIWRWEAAVFGSMLLDVVMHRWFVVRYARAAVERIACEAFRVVPSTSK